MTDGTAPDTDALLLRARTCILNLRGVCEKTARYNVATRDHMLDTLDALNVALGYPPKSREFRRA